MSHSKRSSRNSDSKDAENEEQISLHYLKTLIVKIQSTLEEHKNDMKKKLSDQSKALKDMQTSLTIKIESEIKDMQTTLNTKIEKEIKGLETYIDQQVGQLSTRIGTIEGKLEILEAKENERAMFNYDDTLVAINLPQEPNENIELKADDLIRNGLKVHGVRILRAARLKGRDGKPGLTKIQLHSLDDKKKLLQAKSNLKQCPLYKKVFIRSSKSHEERLAETNFRTILSMIPRGTNFMLTSNGRIVNKTTNNQQNRQRAQGPSGHVSRASADSVDNRVPPDQVDAPLSPLSRPGRRLSSGSMHSLISGH